MKIEILCIPDCPSRAPALARLRTILAEQGVNDPVEEVEVPDRRTAEALAFPGSPSIRIDGTDVEPFQSPRPSAFACRTYIIDGRLSGVPGDVAIRYAIQRAREARERP